MNDIETVAETTQPEAWPKVSLMDLIIERGKGCIYGKFGDWMINGKPVLSHSVKHGALNPACFFGGLTFSPHNDPFLRITTLIYENTPDNQKTANFLVIGPAVDPTSEIGKKLDTQRPVRPIVYLMWSHASHTPDSRAHHIPFQFIVYLPQDATVELILRVKANPICIEDAFQGMFSGLVTHGALQRVRVQILRLIDISQGQVTMQNAQTVLAKSSHEDVSFGNEIGEQPIAI